MKYCIKCVLPDTRPMAFIDSDGICSACKNHEVKNKINWKKKKIDFKKLVNLAKKRSSYYDCLIPVSGGKDSTWQVITCLKYNLSPLTFTYKPVLRTKVGKENIDNLKKLGVHHIEFTVNENVEKKFIKKSFLKFGSMAVSMHMAMWNLAYNLASSFKIPYIFWGENSAVEYSGIKDKKFKYLNENWIKKYGNNFGTTAKDWIAKDLSQKDLAPFFKIKTKKDYIPKSIFLGDYFSWDPVNSFNISKKAGFKAEQSGPRTGIYNFADIDDNILSIHHFIKLYKFGITRAHDNLSLEIRNNRLSRKKAIEIAKKEIKKIPHKDIEVFCKFINITKKDFFKICEKFRNKKIWSKVNKKWHLKNQL